MVTKVEQAMITHALANDPPWLKRAFADLGLQELPGAAARPRIVEMYAKAGHPEIRSDEVAWCSAALNAWMVESTSAVPDRLSRAPGSAGAAPSINARSSHAAPFWSCAAGNHPGRGTSACASRIEIAP
jgi:hypothetical protein